MLTVNEVRIGNYVNSKILNLDDLICISKDDDSYQPVDLSF
jgi:hypothetical protein